ncbi:MAG: SurA N-terminal domain-containing protein [Myxococcota bacterium]
MAGRSRIVGYLVAAALAAAALARPASPARADIIERVVAVVNDQAILLSDLRRRAVPFLPQLGAAETEAERLGQLQQLYRQILQNLIDQELYEQAAKKAGVRVTDADVERAIANVRRQVGLEGDAFWEAVRQQGLTESQYRRDLRQQLLRLKVLNQHVRGRINITEQDVRRKYDERLREANRQLRFRASHCFLAVPDGAGATEVASVRDEAREARKGVSASTFSRCVDAHGGGDLGWLTQGDLPAELEEVLLTMQPGQISRPVRGPGGFHIFLMHERERGGSQIPPFEQVKEQIFRKMLDEAMARQEKLFLEELRQEAVIKMRL